MDIPTFLKGQGQRDMKNFLMFLEFHVFWWMTTKKLLLNDLNYLRLKQKQCMGKPEKTGQSVENQTTICF